VTINENNFGAGITTGGYDGGTCAAVFLEATGADCLGSEGCAGTCNEFLATACALNVTLVANGTDVPKEEEPAFVFTASEESGSESSNLVPIIVSVVVSALAVCGLAGVLFKLKKSKKPSAASVEDVDESPGKGRCGCCKRKKQDRSNLDAAISAEEELFDNDDEV